MRNNVCCTVFYLFQFYFRLPTKPWLLVQIRAHQSNDRSLYLSCSPSGCLYIQPLYIYRFLVIVDFGKEIFRHNTKLILILAVKIVYHFSQSYTSASGTW